MGYTWDTQGLTQDLPAYHRHEAARARPRRKVFPRGWKDAMHAAIAVFFLSASAPFLVLAWHLAGGHW